MSYEAETENLVLNLDEVRESTAFECLPKGDYDAVVDDVTFGKSKKGDPMMTWKFKIDHEEYGKRSFYYYNVLTQPLGLSSLKATLINLGMDIDWSQFVPQDFADMGEVIGLPITINLGIQKYEGERRNTVKKTMASTEGASFMD